LPAAAAKRLDALDLGRLELVFRHVSVRAGLVSTFLTTRIVELADANLDLEREGQIFRKTFDLLGAALNEKGLRRYDFARGRFMGGFLVSVYEAIAIGLGHNADTWADTDAVRAEIVNVAQTIWSNDDFTQHQGSGVRGTDRIQHTVPLGRSLFRR